MQYIKLSNGVETPLLGYGAFQVPPQEAERCVSDALSVGYRLIDTVQAYFNEEGVGEAIAKSGIRREELFLATKVWISNSGEERAAILRLAVETATGCFFTSSPSPKAPTASARNKISTSSTSP